MELKEGYIVLGCDFIISETLEEVHIHVTDLKEFLLKTGYTLSEFIDEYNSSYHIELCNYLVNGGPKKPFKIVSSIN